MIPNTCDPLLPPLVVELQASLLPQCFIPDYLVPGLLFRVTFHFFVSFESHMADRSIPCDALSPPSNLNNRVRKRTASDSAPSVDTAVDSRAYATGPSKRPRTISSKPDEKVEEQHTITPDYAFERRRVNPESLALRLGSVLVRDLDALVPPGSKVIPPFSLRKVIQEKHNIDRRHVYDYYHSKGLRMVKEGGGIASKHVTTILSQVSLNSRVFPHL